MAKGVGLMCAHYTVEVPKDGVVSQVTDADLRANLDPKGKK